MFDTVHFFRVMQISAFVYFFIFNKVSVWQKKVSNELKMILRKVVYFFLIFSILNNGVYGYEEHHDLTWLWIVMALSIFFV